MSFENRDCVLIGATISSGTDIEGCQLGPDTLRAAGIAKTLEELGHTVEDTGNLTPPTTATFSNTPDGENLAETISWSQALQQVGYETVRNRNFPIFMGGDHSLAFGSVPGLTRYAHEQDRPQFVLWIDAHADFHSLDTTESGNLHGTPVAYITGDNSFDGFFPKLDHTLAPENLMIMGMRSVDRAEKARLSDAGITTHDMRQIDEKGVTALLTPFLERVKEENGFLHVSFDVDGLDPDIAPAVGTTVPGGLSYREAHLIMEILHDSNLVTSLDLAELNPLLDVRGQTARLLIDLTASLMGRRVLS
ncbi:arginase [Sneathiella sp. P13V-1]|uniref:arginase n=1 Tax=Sneathiella sp. P13V-1 TaxID=2697366 RepID=UPI00187B9334|nr:arginase [Sneathiella sp. P13V-1]MBE7635227.1 arginase [Sneathiella sp. P13V-1]